MFEVACSEDPVVAGGETYRRPVPPLAPLGTILSSSGRMSCSSEAEASATIQFTAFFSFGCNWTRDKASATPLLSPFGGTGRAVSAFWQCSDERLVVRPDDD